MSNGFQIEKKRYVAITDSRVRKLIQYLFCCGLQHADASGAMEIIDFKLV